MPWPCRGGRNRVAALRKDQPLISEHGLGRRQPLHYLDCPHSGSSLGRPCRATGQGIGQQCPERGESLNVVTPAAYCNQSGEPYPLLDRATFDPRNPRRRTGWTLDAAQHLPEKHQLTGDDRPDRRLHAETILRSSHSCIAQHLADRNVGKRTEHQLYHHIGCNSSGRCAQWSGITASTPRLVDTEPWGRDVTQSISPDL